MTPQPHTAPDQARLSVVNDPEQIRRAEGLLVEAIERHAYSKAAIFAIRLSFNEAISNAFRHGHATLPADLPVFFTYAVAADQVRIEIEDQGPGFDPSTVPDPTLEENIERGSGRGLLLIRSYMASAEYNAKGNRLAMVYQRPGTSQAAS
ncbi:MAG: ATP-binding protein [Phycisphaeraceae bacterium]|nr:ATP-binding protein [Phycisphaeraceae bacterium]